jgi:hypothetical protein
VQATTTQNSPKFVPPPLVSEAAFSDFSKRRLKLIVSSHWGRRAHSQCGRFEEEL